MQQIHIRVRGMMCSFCVQTIDKALRRLQGVEQVNVSLAHEEARVVRDGTTVLLPVGEVEVGDVMLISLLSFVAWMLLSTPLNALFAALSVAVIGYPCALGLSTPLALMRGTGLGAERGVLIRSGVAFQRLKDVDTVLFDKTGTLTPGRPVVTDLVAWEGEETALLELAASVEALSEHPLGAAIVQRAQTAGLGAYRPVEDFVALPGQGVRACLGGDLILVGKPQLLAAQDVLLTRAMQAQLAHLAAAGKTVVLVARAGEWP